ncbi:hypothetical protein AB0M39_11715 [Streptomyces sp. NPDC051907]
MGDGGLADDPASLAAAGAVLLLGGLAGARLLRRRKADGPED